MATDYAWDLTLSDGWLGELAGLKSLKSLGLRAYFWRAMGQAEGLPDQLSDAVKEPDTLCINLTRINLFDLDIDYLHLISGPLLTLLNHNTRLTHLDVTRDIFEIEGVPAALSKLRHLQHLAVHSDHEDIDIQQPLLVLQACLALPELTELNFDGLEMRWDDGDVIAVRRELEAVIEEAAIARYTRNSNAKKIKLLTLPGNRVGHGNPLPLLLLKSGLLHLETFELPWFEADIQEVEQVVREHCPNLKHLKYPCIAQEWEEPAYWNSQAARAFISGCTGLRSFDATYFNDALDDEAGLILPELVSRHHSTLEKLFLYGTGQVSSRDLQEVLSRCKQLRRFWVMGIIRGSMSGITFRDISRSDWVCTELRELGITLDRCRCERDPPGELQEERESEDPHVCLDADVLKRAFQQIGRLGKLEVLKIDSDRSSRTRAMEADYAWDLTLWKGWLGELAGLKNLKTFRLGADFWRAMGQAEVEFMHEHWPLLSEISIWCERSQFKMRSHWRWLLRKRPHLRFVLEPYVF
ncbi:hypothetical protein BGZ72_004350 [Mortierella alpina]|nr:hypothetical protein BGZ72_004350 [Mortierella alpina]